jgi:hypothetical protein
MRDIFHKALGDIFSVTTTSLYNCKFNTPCSTEQCSHSKQLYNLQRSSEYPSVVLLLIRRQPLYQANYRSRRLGFLWSEARLRNVFLLLLLLGSTAVYLYSYSDNVLMI